ncbi:MAG TPA: type 2 isopentenyl-diphosphate Delta-isomerase [Anaerolineae bacterium]|nr:type 2 isopentenyl-diphosphate Delta-isomerase [Anaerolineae bacterium]
MSKVTPTSRRKADHIQVTLEKDVHSGLKTGLDGFLFEHTALPELDLHAIETDLEFLGKKLRAPILISSMTGGTAAAAKINRILAEAAQEAGVALGLGSQRVALEQPELTFSFQVRDLAPDILLMANLGAVQLNYGLDVAACKQVVEVIEADALILHLNPLQEALQPEGNVNFSNLLNKIEAVCTHLEVPVIVKEVGWGLSTAVAKQLADVGVTAFDVAGAGGTSWAKVEMHRAKNERQANLAAAFVHWGIPTADALIQIRKALPGVPLIASGGIRTGIDIAKCITLGADMTGVALPFLQQAVQSKQAVSETLESMIDVLRTCMFATGSANCNALKRAKLVPKA